jgi:hypothetical protein
MTLALICLPSESVCRKKRVSNEELAKRLDALERTNEWQFEKVHEAIEQLTTRVRRRKPNGSRVKVRKKRKPKSGGNLVDHRRID